MALRRRGSFPVRGQRRLTAWNDGTGGTTTTAISGNGSTFVGSAFQAVSEGLTLIRIRGYFDTRLTLATSANDGFHWAFGIGIASLAAVTAGVASVPTPLTEQGSENWLYWMSGVNRGAQAFSAGGGPGMEQAGTFFRFEIDSKAMRKLPTDLSIYAIIEVVENGVATMDVMHDSRSLVKLP